MLEPDNEFVDGWHLHTICEHLEAATRGEIRRLIINIAPRHCKSLLVSVLWPAWEWATNPAMRWLFTSYGDDLAVRDSVKTRNVVKSMWYQQNWGRSVQLVEDQDTKHKFETTARGYRMATSVTGGITGEGGDRLVLDDPHNALQANSEVERTKVKEFVDRAWSSRVNDPKKVVKAVIMQRLHEDDVTAHLLAKEAGWVHLCLPTEYVPTTRVFFNGTKDPRIKEAELLWPQRFGVVEVADAKRDLGDYGFAGQHQQNPTARTAGMFNVAKLRACIVQHRPEHAVRGRGWDLAATTKKDSKRTAGVLMSKDEHGAYYVEHVTLGKWTPDKRNETMKARTRADGHEVMVKVEHEGGSSGEDQALAIAKMLVGFAVESLKVSGDKATRADGFAAQCNEGNVHLIDNGTWDIEAYLAELGSFPEGTYKDQVDASSLMFNVLAPITVEHIVEEVGVRPPVPQQDPHWSSQLPVADWRSKL